MTLALLTLLAVGIGVALWLIVRSLRVVSLYHWSTRMTPDQRRHEIELAKESGDALALTVLTDTRYRVDPIARVLFLALVLLFFGAWFAAIVFPNEGPNFMPVPRAADKPGDLVPTPE